MLEVILFILATLFLASLSGIIAHRYGKIWLIGTFVAMVLMANIFANKIVVFFYWAVPAGIIVYSSTFLLSNILSEVYGKRSAQEAVWIGFFVNVLLAISVVIAIEWPAADFWKNQDAFSSTFGNTWRIVIASMVAYLASQRYDIFSYSFFKKRTKGKFLWLRNTLSTAISQFIDTILFITLAFYGVFPIIPMIIGQFLSKIILAIIDNPFIYFVKSFYKNSQSS